MGETDHLNIWHSFKKGSWSSYAKLYELYYGLLSNYGHRFTKDTELIEDAIHDLFVRLWTSKERIGDPVSVKNYFYKALRNNLFRKLKYQRRTEGMPADDYAPGFQLTNDNAGFTGIEEKEMQERIRTIISSLPPRQQEMIFLRFYEGLSYEEIADIMDITIGSVYKLFYKAIYKLQQTAGLVLLFSLLCHPDSFPDFFLP